MRINRKISSKLSPRAIWAVTITVFVVCSAFAVFFGVTYINRPVEGDALQSVEAVSRDDYLPQETDPAVTTKAQNTGDPYMTTVIIEVPVTSDTTAADTVDETTGVDTTEVVTETVPPETTAVTDTTAETTAVETEAPVPEEPVYGEGDWSLLLLNPWNALPEGYTPQLVSIGNGHQADYRIKTALENMLNDCRNAGYNLVVCSSYRTIDRQVVLFENETREFMSYGYDRATAEVYASQWVARPGTSEHHTGLAFDIVSGSYQVLNSSQAETPDQRWLMENCHNYGFILRYPDNKTDITGINYEPWHYRYVGPTAAKEIYERQITLEEYLSQGE